MKPELHGQAPCPDFLCHNNGHSAANSGHKQVKKRAFYVQYIWADGECLSGIILLESRQ